MIKCRSYSTTTGAFIISLLLVLYTVTASPQTTADKTGDSKKPETVTNGKGADKKGDNITGKDTSTGTKKENLPATDNKSKDQTAGSNKDTKVPDKKADDPKKEAQKKGMPDDTKKAEKIESTLEYGMQKDRKTAIIMINEVKDEQIKNRLIQKLITIVENDTDIEIRKTAVTVIGDNRYSAATNSLIKALDDPEEDVQIAACYALGKIKAESSKTKLVELFNKRDLKKDSNLTDAIITTLYELKAPDILETAVKAGKDSSTSRLVRERLIMYIGYTGSAAQKDFLIELYKNDDEDVLLRSYAIKSISKLKIKDTVPDIKKTIKEIDSYPFNKRKKYYDLYMFSVAALVEMGDAESIELLMTPLRSDNSAVRLRAVNLIKEFNDQRTIDILKYKMKNDPNAKVRKAARKALEEKGIIEKGKDIEESGNDTEREDKYE